MDIPTAITTIVFFIAFGYSTLALLDFLHNTYITSLMFQKNTLINKKKIIQEDQFLSNSKKKKQIDETNKMLLVLGNMAIYLYDDNMKSRICAVYFSRRKFILLAIGLIGLIYCILYSILLPLFDAILPVLYQGKSTVLDSIVAVFQILFFIILAYFSYNGLRILGAISGNKYCLISVEKTYSEFRIECSEQA